MPSRYLLSDAPPPSDDLDRRTFIEMLVVFGVIVIVLIIKFAYDEKCNNPPSGSGNPVNPRPGADALPVHRPPAGAGNRTANPRQEAPPVRAHHHRSPPPPQQPARAVDGLPILKFSDETRTLVGAAEEGCVICLSEFESGDDLTVLPKCNHGFHVMCIEGWWKEFHSCPTCRTMYWYEATPPHSIGEDPLFVPSEKSHILCQNCLVLFHFHIIDRYSFTFVYKVCWLRLLIN